LIAGLFGPLVWVYLSIALWILWLPAAGVGAVLLVRRRTMSGWEFNPAPGWPASPQGWSPPPEWRPDPTWPSPPESWEWWTRTGDRDR
jgi:hypothetical protein